MKQNFLQRIEIYQTIISEIIKSETEILVFFAWLNNEEVFNILLGKQKQGIKVKLIIEDDLTNQKIRFSDLIKAGGEIFKIEKDGLGMINTKYCIIDEKIAFLTLFNWSADVLANTAEAVVITHNYKTIQNLKTRFYGMTGSATRIGGKNIEGSLITRLKNGILKFLGAKVKETESIKQVGLEKDLETLETNEFKTNKTDGNIDDEFRNFFSNRN